MNIELIKIENGYCVEEEGKYLVRTISNSKLKTIQYLQARVTKHFNTDKNIWEMSIDVNNQTPTHISIRPLSF